MRDFVKDFGVIKHDGIYLCLTVDICYPVTDCLNEFSS